ncbi:hypothetical protein GTG28_04795 [Vibrio sp. OCN044]|uniref:HTH cro/C1-type domain-containing protein n=1 Tax=Vibrio tetraodonis subsp. pristinus TaxID=2695891 RepID=A0A6L8LRX2_9VIBR|nr:hypothetical protein [Vibrio tetraodonis]MYM58535.1 hypothetical protein [Vibrio tetraodonis subsp. pristinus]
MITSLDLLNQLKVEKQLLSNRQVAVFLGINHMTVNRIVKGGVWSDELACIIAQELELDVDLVLLAIISERCNNERVTDAIEDALEKRNLA